MTRANAGTIHRDEKIFAKTRKPRVDRGTYSISLEAVGAGLIAIMPATPRIKGAL